MIKNIHKNERLFRISLVLLLVLNLIDALMTRYWVVNNIARETNPLMNAWIQISPDLFIFLKILLVTMGVMLLWICRKHRLAYWAGVTLLSVYSGILLIHMHIAFLTLFYEGG